LLEDAGKVDADGFGRDAKPGADLGVGVSLGGELGDGPLLRGERGEGTGCPWAGVRRGRLRRAVSDLAQLLEVTGLIAAQARQRLAGTMPDGAARRVSLHEPDARPIAKGRLGKPVEFGYKAQVTDNDDGIVVDYAME
jgi:IS5 family transposase